jgi:hypothetical protein
VTLNWTAASGATGYTLWQSAFPTLLAPRLVSTGTGLSYAATLPVGTYYFSVNAVNAWGVTRSNVVVVTILAPTRTPTPTPVAAPGIVGRVTEGGVPAPGILLRLRFYKGTRFETVGESSTAADGTYRFANLATLNPGQAYYVQYPNFEANTSRLGAWGSFRVLSYTAGTRVDGGSFDIKGIPLQAPADNASVALPATFRWTQRGITGDSYVWELYRLIPSSTPGEPPTLETLATSQLLGNTNSFTLSNLPPGAEPGISYGWSLQVHNQPRDVFNYGIAFYYRVVGFTNSSLSLDAMLGESLLRPRAPAWAEFERVAP